MALVGERSSPMTPPSSAFGLQKRQNPLGALTVGFPTMLKLREGVVGERTLCVRRSAPFGRLNHRFPLVVEDKIFRHDVRFV